MHWQFLYRNTFKHYSDSEIRLKNYFALAIAIYTVKNEVWIPHHPLDTIGVIYDTVKVAITPK